MKIYNQCPVYGSQSWQRIKTYACRDCHFTMDYSSLVCAEWYSQTGAMHLNSNRECEDVFIAKEEKDLLFYGLADGQSGKAFCTQGAYAVLTVITDYIKKKGITTLSEYEHVDEIQYEIIKIIREKLNDLAATRNTSVYEFASTILALGIDPKTGKYVTVHLGDGGIFGKRSDGSFNFISTPDNGITSKYTWLTTSENALLHLRIGFGSIFNYKRVVMYTDGAEVICRGTSITQNAKRIVFDNEESWKIGEILKTSEPADDATCVVIDCDKVSENFL